MLDIIALVIAILVLIVLLSFRAVWALSIGEVSARLVHDEAPALLTDLVARMRGEIENLGFSDAVQVSLCEKNGGREISSYALVHKNPQQSTLLWCHLPQAPEHANKALTYWTSRLADGRIVISEAFDPYFQAVATPKTPAQTISGDNLSEQLERHLKFVASFDSVPASNATEDSEIIYQAGQAHNENNQRLLDAGRIYQDKQGLLRVTFVSALHIFWLLLTRPKPKPTTADISAAQLVHLAAQMRRMRENEPSLPAQLAIFITSMALALIIGAILWDWELTAMLLVVVIFHELGHYLAMRLFGYQNIHIMALPLVGGVTIGIDKNPNAWRQAWMSLMGPLPSILFGWALWLWGMKSPGEVPHPELFYSFITMVLAINYLNILPVMPLDGGHVLQALLPPKWLKIQGVMILLLCTAGALIAYAFDFYILVLLAFLQLLTVHSNFKLAGLVAKLADNPAASSNTESAQRMLAIFQALENGLGACRRAMPRINQAERIAKILDTQPMRTGQRLIAAAVFSVLLVVPIGFLLLTLSLNDNFMAPDTETNEAAISERERQLTEQAASKTVAQLLDDLRSNRSAQAEAVTETAEANIAEKVAALPFALPEDLLAIYRTTEQLPGLGILPVEQIGVAGDSIGDQLQTLFPNGTIFIDDALNANAGNASLPVAEALTWLYIGGLDEENIVLLEPINGDKAVGGRVLQLNYGQGNIHPSFRAWLEQKWIAEQHSADIQHRIEQATQETFQALQPQSLNAVLGEFKEYSEPSGFLQWLLRLTQNMPDLPEAWPPGADDSQIEATEKRLNVTFPQAMKSIYHLHNGMSHLTILPLQDIIRASEQQEVVQQMIGLHDQWQPIGDNGQLVEAVKDNLIVDQCLIVGGNKAEELVYPSTLWCPTQSDAAVVDLYAARTFSNLDSFIRYKIAGVLAVSRGRYW